ALTPPARQGGAGGSGLKGLCCFFGFRPELWRENGPCPDPGSTARSHRNDTALIARLLRVAFPVGPGFVFSCALARCCMAPLTTPARSPPSPPRTGTAAPGPLQAAHTANFPALLRQLGTSLLVTPYQAGKLVLVRDEGDRLNTHYRSFQSPMGLALADG